LEIENAGCLMPAPSLRIFYFQEGASANSIRRRE
jgi:hypothetical protein